MAGDQRGAGKVVRHDSGEAEVERRTVGEQFLGCFHFGPAPRVGPAVGDDLRKRCTLREVALEQVGEDAMDEAARTAFEQRERGGEDGVWRRVEANALGERHAQHHARLGILGQRQAHRAIDGLVEQRHAAEHFARDRGRETGVGRRKVSRGVAGGLVERFVAAQYGVEQPERGGAGGDARIILFGAGSWHGAS